MYAVIVLKITVKLFYSVVGLKAKRKETLRTLLKSRGFILNLEIDTKGKPCKFLAPICDYFHIILELNNSSSSCLKPAHSFVNLSFSIGD